MNNVFFRKLTYRYWKFFLSQRLKKFHNLYEGESCFIIGNGPSLNKMNLSLLKDYHTFGLNKIFLLEDRGIDLNLSFLVSVNPLVIEQSWKEFKKLKCPVFLPYLEGKKYLKKGNNIQNIYTGRGAFFQKNIRGKVEEGHTVTYVAMQIAYYMGFKTVYLIGVDHSFNAVGKPNSKQILKGRDVNHFDPNYFKGKEWHLPDLEASEFFYRVAKFTYELDGRKIYNSTVGGKLDIFDRVSYKKALKECKKKNKD